MSTLTATISRYNRSPKTTDHRILSKKSFLDRCCYLIESTDWDEKIIRQEKWINSICLSFAILSALYFAPVLILSLLK